MSDQKHETIVKIMDRNFSVKCPSDKVTELHKAAKYLDVKIKETINTDSKIINKDHLIVIAALNIINELFQNKKELSGYVEETNKSVSDIQGLIENILDGEATKEV